MIFVMEFDWEKEKVFEYIMNAIIVFKVSPYIKVWITLILQLDGT